jgi:outer membrane lipoprotein-sorting protein
MKRCVLIFLFLHVIIGLFNCAPKKPIEPFKECVSSPASVLKRISRTSGPNHILKATAKIIVDSSKGKYSRNIAIIVKKPSFIRIEAIPFFGTPDFFLSVNKKTLKVFLPKKGNFYIGHATRKNLFSLFQIYLDADEIVSILTGTPPVIRKDNHTLRGYFEGDLYRIDIISEGKKIQSLWVEPKHNRMLRIEVFNEDGGIYYSARFKDYYPIRKTSYPKIIKITIEEPERIHASILYSNIQTSSRGEKNLFDLLIPNGIIPAHIGEYPKSVME